MKKIINGEAIFERTSPNFNHIFRGKEKILGFIRVSKKMATEAAIRIPPLKF